MKNLKTILFALSVLLLVACGKNKQETAVNTLVAKQAIPVVDVTKTYPPKEIVLQDIADVEYIPLETRDDVLIEGSKSIVYCSKDTIIVHNKVKGDLLFFNGKGEFVSKFNHKGQGREEYIYGLKTVFDKQQKELFISDKYGNNKERLLVYDTKGVYKRTLFTELTKIGTFVNYGENKMLVYEPFWNFSNREVQKNLTPFMFISKATGELDTLKQFKLEDRVNSVLINRVGQNRGMAAGFDSRHIVPFAKDLFLLNDYYSDIIFSFSSNKKLIPICRKEPSIKEQEKEKNILTSIVEANEKWLFLKLQIKDYDFKTEKYAESRRLLIDIATKSINEYQLINKDISEKSVEIIPRTTFLNSADLIELLEEGKLKGKLKTVAENLKEDDNPVLMKITFKN